MTLGAIMKPKYWYLLLIIIPVVALFLACETEYRCSQHCLHYHDEMWIEAEVDTIYLFFAAGTGAYNNTPVSFTIENEEESSDSIRLNLIVFGMSYDLPPQPYKEVFWKSDTVYVWYDATKMRPDQFCPQSDRGLLGTTWPEPYYKIDHAYIRVPSNKFVYAHSEVVWECF